MQKKLKLVLVVAMIACAALILLFSVGGRKECVKNKFGIYEYYANSRPHTQEFFCPSIFPNGGVKGFREDESILSLDDIKAVRFEVAETEGAPVSGLVIKFSVMAVAKLNSFFEKNVDAKFVLQADSKYLTVIDSDIWRSVAESDGGMFIAVAGQGLKDEEIVTLIKQLRSDAK